jgi:hypothetical protein
MNYVLAGEVICSGRQTYISNVLSKEIPIKFQVVDILFSGS